MKKQKHINKLIIKNKKYIFEDALVILKSICSKNFEESIEASIQLTVIPKKNIVVKGYSVLKHSIGKEKKIGVFTESNEVLSDCILLNKDNLKDLNKKNITFDIILTTPSDIVKIGKIGKLLSGKKIMPDIKYGTITTDITGMINKLKGHYIKYKFDKNYAANLIIGKIKLPAIKLKENIEQIISDLKSQKPQNCKSINIKKIIISSTMGPGLKIDIDSINC